MKQSRSSELARLISTVVRELFHTALAVFACASAYGWWTASEGWMLWGAQGAAITITAQLCVAGVAIVAWSLLRVARWRRQKA